MLLIDGYNLLFAGHPRRIEIHDMEKERERFLHLLLRYCEVSGRRAIVVFDHTRGAPIYGAPLRRAMGALEYRFTTDDVTADEEIIAMAENTDDVTAYTVVTSDREILDAVEKRRMKFILSKDFVDELVRVLRGDEDRRPERNLSTEEVDYWLREFGVDE